MSENEKRGRPAGSDKRGYNKGYTTNRFALKYEEAEELEKKYQAFKKANNINTLSKSEFYRMLILKGLKGIKCN